MGGLRFQLLERQPLIQLYQLISRLLRQMSLMDYRKIILARQRVGYVSAGLWIQNVDAWLKISGA